MRTIVIGGVALLLCAATVSISAAGVFRASAPATALALFPWDARANARIAQGSLLEATARRTRPDIAGITERARRAWRTDPLAVESVTALAMVAAVQRNPGTPRMFTYAERLSRRNVETQMWLIEYNVRRNDIPGALGHYNVVLSTAAQARPALASILIGASSQPEVARELNRLLRTRPNWRLDFLTRFALDGRDAGALAAVSRHVLDPAIPDDREVLRRVLTRYVTLANYELAWDAYSDAMRGVPGNQPGLLLRNGDFARDEGLPPFDWTYPADGRLVPERRSQQGANYSFALHLPLNPDSDAETASQMVRLSEGRYELQATVGDVPAAANARPFIRVSCLGEPRRDVLAADFPMAPSDGGRMRAQFAIPSNCPFQRMAIWVRGNLDAAPQTASWVSAISLRRL